jgi:hypothetical protein
MSDGSKPLNRWLLLGELVACIAFGAALTASYLGVPPSVHLGMPLSLAVASGVLVMAAILGLFNLALSKGRAGRRTLSLVLLVCAILLLPVLLALSFPQY